ncbi:MAG: hypothetical protein ACYC5Q_03890 [Thermoleophilia bacterium]
MAKPRRKHAAIGTIEESPQGKSFLLLWQETLGAEALSYAPLEALRDGTHLFLIRGPAGWAVLVDGKEKARGNEWFTRYGILFEPAWSPLSWQLELTTHRWDPWLHAKHTGDATVRDSSPANRRRVSEALRAEGGSRKDRLILRMLPFDRPARRVAGVPREVIQAVLEKHGLKGGDYERLLRAEPGVE